MHSSLVGSDQRTRDLIGSSLQRDQSAFGADRSINMQELKIISDPYQLNESF